MRDLDSGVGELVERVQITPEKIDRAIAWYCSHKDSICMALPLECPGVTYGKGWLASLEKNMQLWRDGDYSLLLARAYIHGPLTRVYVLLRSSGQLF
ncbi:MAG: hypothetical protein AAF703_23040 [Cyanobacteria bacterium P01_D01_bin.105]